MLIEFSAEVIVRCEMAKIIAVYFLPRFYAFSYEEHDIDHKFRPRRKAMISIDEDVL